MRNITDEHNANENPSAVEPRPSPTVFLSDPDVTLWHGDVRETLAQLEAGSVDCVVTSPPYWGLRDYGTGAWEGGDVKCDHAKWKPWADAKKQPASETYSQYRDVCGKCGATRTDQQLGLEPTPELYIENMVGVFREVWRVLADHGTCWVNMGDSYNSAEARKSYGDQSKRYEEGRDMGIKRPLIDGLKVKDLVGMPWRLAFTLQADGWYLRSDIVWSKPNPMPESVTDRPTKSHEYVFLLAKRPRYFFDQEAVREQSDPWNSARGFSGNGKRAAATGYDLSSNQFRDRPEHDFSQSGRNIRSVWEIATQPYPEAHFATFPEELARRCILAGCPEWVCGVCGKPRERITDVSYGKSPVHGAGSVVGRHEASGQNNYDGAGMPRLAKLTETVGWTSCGCRDGCTCPGGDSCGGFSCGYEDPKKYRPGRVLDPFVGSGTVPHVARKHGRHAVGIDLNGDYLKLAGKRLQQLSLLSEVNL